MINKLTTVNAVISKVVRDFAIDQEEIRWQDMIEWIAEGLLLIGAYPQFKEKEAIIAVEDYKGVLPCDFYQAIKYLDGCEIGEQGGPYWDQVNNVLDTCGYRDTNPDCKTEEGDCFKVVDMYTFQKLQLAQYNRVGYFDNFFGQLSRNSNLIGRGITYSGMQKAYNVNLDSITATFRYGFIGLRYLAVPVDEQGYPLVPDDISFLEALTWRCIEKLATRGHQFKNPDFNNMETAKFYWNKYCMQARGKANMPDPDMMEQLKNVYTNMIPNLNEYRTDFNSLGQANHTNFRGIY